jgi:hypothetical protein
MSFAHKALRAAGISLVLLLFGLPVHAQGRPSALDARVDALSVARLSTNPAPALVDPDRQIAAARYVNWRITGFLLSFALPIGILIYYWRNGFASARRDGLRRRFRSEFAVRWIFGAILAAIAWTAALLPQFFLYRLDRVMGISPQSWTQWAASWVVSFAMACVVTGTIAAVILWLADRTHQWYLYTMAGVIVVAAIYERGGGFASADGAGLPADTPGEVAFYTARLAEHWAVGDPLRSALVLALIIIVAMAIAVTIADRIGFRRDDDPVSRLALVGGLLGCAYLIALPAYLAYDRASAARADIAAVAATGDRASAVRAMVRRADQDLEPVCPNEFAMLYFAQTPALGERISTFNGTPDPCK